MALDLTTVLLFDYCLESLHAATNGLILLSLRSAGLEVVIFS